MSRRRNAIVAAGLLAFAAADHHLRSSRLSTPQSHCHPRLLSEDHILTPVHTMLDLIIRLIQRSDQSYSEIPLHIQENNLLCIDHPLAAAVIVLHCFRALNNCVPGQVEGQQNPRSCLYFSLSANVVASRAIVSSTPLMRSSIVSIASLKISSSG